MPWGKQEQPYDWQTGNFGVIATTTIYIYKYLRREHGDINTLSQRLFLTGLIQLHEFVNRGLVDELSLRAIAIKSSEVKSENESICLSVFITHLWRIVFQIELRDFKWLLEGLDDEIEEYFIPLGIKTSELLAKDELLPALEIYSEQVELLKGRIKGKKSA